MASGLQRNFGTMTKPLHAGWASRSALAAVNLARSGFTAATDVLEAPSGFFAACGVEASRQEAAIERLGNPWVIVDPGLALKALPLLLRLTSGYGRCAPTQARAWAQRGESRSA